MHNFFSFSRFLFLFYEVKPNAATQPRNELVKKYVCIYTVYISDKENKNLFFNCIHHCKNKAKCFYRKMYF